jgi:tetratricopeptide (TPR) repeat protein
LKGTSSLLNLTLVLLGLAVIVGLTYVGYKTDTKEIADNHEGHNHKPGEHDKPVEAPFRVNDASLPEDANLDKVIDDALSSIQKGKETNDMSLVMNAGIMQLLAVNRADTNNVRAIYHLGLFAEESGQLEKAEKRFEKLILLQPENQEYKDNLAKIRQKLN